MAKPEAGPMSGFRDMLAEQMIPRQEMLNTIRQVYERYGFTPLDTPGLERLETLTGKYGAEADKLIYKFEDQGGRKVALRYDLTVPLARVAGQHESELVFPYKRYQVGPVWRGESPQAGRYREFIQFDADTVGTKSVIADTEIVQMMSDAMLELGAEAKVSVNNRRILDALVEKSGIVDEREIRAFIATIDKFAKVGLDKVLLDVEDIGGAHARNLTRAYLTVAGDSEQRLEAVAKILSGSEAADEGINNLKEVFNILTQSGYGEDRATFDQTIARGLDYYTGIIYETLLNDLPSIGSVCSGGRYDNLVKDLGGPNLPAVGASIGVDRLFEGLRQLDKVKTTKTNTEIVIANFSQLNAGKYMDIATQLRKKGIATEVYYESDKLGKQFKFADRKGIRFVALMGDDEITIGVIKVRNLQTGVEKEYPAQDFADMFKKEQI